MKKGTKHMNEAEFEAIKRMFELGLTPKQVSAVSKRSGSLVAMVKKSSSLEDYKERMEALRKPKVELETSLVDVVSEAVEQEAERVAYKPQDELTKALSDLAKGFTNMAERFETMAGKMDEVLETKKPWLNKIKF